MNEADIAAYAQILQSTYNLELRLLRRLIKMQVNRTKPAELYDLDFDVQLQAALDIAADANFAALVKSAKTLKELQESASEEQKISAADAKSGKKGR